MLHENLHSIAEIYWIIFLKSPHNQTGGFYLLNAVWLSGMGSEDVFDFVAFGLRTGVEGLDYL